MPLSWMCKKTDDISLSTIEAEFTAASIIARELLSIRELLQYLSVSFEEPISLRVDNQAALRQLDGDSASAKAKYIDARIKFVGDSTKHGTYIPKIKRLCICLRTYEAPYGKPPAANQLVKHRGSNSDALSISTCTGSNGKLLPLVSHNPRPRF